MKAEIDVPIPSTADEALGLRMARSGAVDVFNTGLGYAGFEPCRRTFAMARQFGLKTLMGNTVEMSRSCGRCGSERGMSAPGAVSPGRA